MQIKYKKVIIALLVSLSILVSSTTFAYWSSTIEGTSYEAQSSLQIGSGNSVQTSISIDTSTEGASGLLVPSSQIENSLGFVTDHIDFLYQLQWLEDNLVSQVSGEDIYRKLSTSFEFEITPNLDTSPLDKEMYANIYNLIHVTASEDNPNELLLNDETAKEFIYSVTMDEPNNKEEYNIIHNSTVKITFTFSMDSEENNNTLDFVEMSKNDLLLSNAVSPTMDEWLTNEGEELSSVDNYKTKYIYFPVNKEEYTITLHATLSEISTLNGGYGILFDTSFKEDDYAKDSGYIFQFDRGYSNGEMIVRPRTDGKEGNPFWTESYDNNFFFPSKHDDPAWWVSPHEITIDISILNDTEKEALFYIDDVFIGSTIYERNQNQEDLYVGLRVWGSALTYFTDLSID